MSSGLVLAASAASFICGTAHEPSSIVAILPVAEHGALAVEEAQWPAVLVIGVERHGIGLVGDRPEPGQELLRRLRRRCHSRLRPDSLVDDESVRHTTKRKTINLSVVRLLV